MIGFIFVAIIVCGSGGQSHCRQDGGSDEGLRAELPKDIIIRQGLHPHAGPVRRRMRTKTKIEEDYLETTILSENGREILDGIPRIGDEVRSMPTPRKKALLQRDGGKEEGDPRET